ncbi:hypothetical protein L2E82_35961 [Cichorium intybus]|uniref:Uncharacterized protein n=1 Tax=Cichorium intybus TaxID=13427 RepID=A0ACB9BQI1_CICIN|nr:hypothetical protein L2E82_35961 [Cichorium intybus]
MRMKTWKRKAMLIPRIEVGAPPAPPVFGPDICVTNNEKPNLGFTESIGPVAKPVPMGCFGPFLSRIDLIKNTLDSNAVSASDRSKSSDVGAEMLSETISRVEAVSARSRIP